MDDQACRGLGGPLRVAERLLVDLFVLLLRSTWNVEQDTDCHCGLLGSLLAFDLTPTRDTLRQWPSGESPEPTSSSATAIPAAAATSAGCRFRPRAPARPC